LSRYPLKTRSEDIAHNTTMNDNTQNGGASYILSCPSKRRKPQPLETRQITLDSPCAKCGESSGKLGAGRQPKESSLHCGKCGSFIRWVSASEVTCLPRRTPVKGTPVKGTPVKGTPVEVTCLQKPPTASEHPASEHLDSEHLCLTVTNEGGGES
jgi:hypothetical protein